MKADGKAVIIITHKLNEVMAISDRVTVLRKGRSVGTVNTGQIDISKLTELIVGRSVSLEIKREEIEEKQDRLNVVHLTCKNEEGRHVLEDVSFTLRSGEILGVAGVAGSGQRELCEAIAGLYPVAGGAILYQDESASLKENIVGKSPKEIIDRGITMAFVPEDRLGMGLVAGMDMVENMMLKSYGEGKGPFVDRKPPRAMAERLIKELEIVTPASPRPFASFRAAMCRRYCWGGKSKVTPPSSSAHIRCAGWISIPLSPSIACWASRKRKALPCCILERIWMCCWNFATGFSSFAAAKSAALWMQKRPQKNSSA